ncbi:MAG: hypothetical protein QOC81_3021 [Thermoanaerobaculia bacterium]|jgi:hypothetical protein|nr:hypothetical protein [Thermoanaerobaculia bacterium]
MYAVHFVGLNYFNACKVGQKDVLVPNGTPGSGKDDDQIPQHFASLFIEEEQCASDDWWPEQKHIRPIQLEIKLGEFRTVNVIEFRLPEKPSATTPPANVHFECKEKTLRNLNLDQGLPKLQTMGFVLDDEPDAIAKVPLPGGALEVLRFGASTIVRWLILEHDDPITITAHAGKETKHVRLKKSDGQLVSEIVFSNTVDLLPHPEHDGNGESSGQGTAVHDGGMTMSGVRHAVVPAVHGGMAGTHDAPAAPGMHGHDHGSAGHFVLYAKLDEERDEKKFENPNLPDPMQLTPAPFTHAYLAYLSSLEEVPDPPCSGGCC